MSHWTNNDPDIEDAQALLQQTLQDSEPVEMPVYDDPQTAMFSGPVGEGVPTSVSSMRFNRARSRSRSRSRLSQSGDTDEESINQRSLRKQRRRKASTSGSRSRRQSTASSVNSNIRSASRSSSLPNAIESENSDSDADTHHRRIRSRKTSSRRSHRRKDRHKRAQQHDVSADESSHAVSSPDPGSSSDSDYPEPYGPYGSSVSQSSSEESSTESIDRQQPVSRHRVYSRTQFTTPFGTTTDPVFGETRIDIYDSPDEDDEEPQPTRPFTQSVYIIDQDLHVVFNGWGYKTYKMMLWTVVNVLSVGIVYLLGRWFPDLWLSGTSKRRSFRRADYIVAETTDGSRHILPISKFTFEKPVPLYQIFCNDFPSSGDVDSSLSDRTRDSQYVTSCRYIEYRYHKFILHPTRGEFILFRDLNDPLWRDVKSLKSGVTSNIVTLRQLLFGPNEIDIKARTSMQLLFDEILHPFYIFQVFSIILWSMEDYYYYAATIFIISVSSITTTLLETKKNMQRMREMSRFTCPINAYRDSSWQTINSSELVPGDLIDVGQHSLEIFPCDSVLLSGDALVNECMLTGESVPVSKIPAKNDAIQMMRDASKTGEIGPDLAKHVLYSGTRVIRVRPTGPLHDASSNSNDAEAIAMVYRTGFNTVKGSLIRSMLFPKPIGFKFYRDSFRFIGVLALIAALGFIISAINFIRMGIDGVTILIKALDLITVVVPPALPATMSIGTSFALSRLRKRSIHCISPTRINVGGKIDVAAFDKTGTLTEDGLDVLGVHYVERSKKLSSLETDVDNIPLPTGIDAKTPLIYALTTCHSLKIVNGEVIGDPLDLRMFESTQWTLEDGNQQPARPSVEVSKRIESAARKGQSSSRAAKSSKIPPRPATLVQMVVRPPGGQTFALEDALKSGGKHAHFLELGVIRTFEFVSVLRRMSVLVKKLKSTSIEAYVKGAPEVMVNICDKDSLPDDYNEMLDYYTRRGFRVIALAGKSIPNLTWVKAQRMKREQVESNLRFLGLIIFENKLKEETIPVIHTLRAARIGVRMCTGDNIRTAISVARECGMVGHHTKVYMPAYIQNEAEEDQSTQSIKDLQWTDVENENEMLDSYSLEPIIRNEDNEIISVSSTVMEEYSEYALALSGDIFRWMLDNSAYETLQRMLVKGVIFARMSPDEKHELVERLQSIGYTVSFCGDGANDCGALRAADVGISLSEAEASVAAPFTSQIANISCVVEVIKEGRAALVTSFSCFKYMALYSLIQFTTISLLYAIASNLGDFQFLFIDLFLIIPIAVTMGRTESFPTLSTKRPTTNLVSKKVLTSLFGQVFITSMLQFFIFFYLRGRPWYTPPVAVIGDIEIKNYENSSLFLFSCWQYIIVAIVFSVGPPYRKKFYTNTWFLMVLCALCVVSGVLLFSEAGSIRNIESESRGEKEGTKLTRFLELVNLPHEFKLELLLCVIFNMSISWAWEYGISQHVAEWIGQSIKTWRRYRHQQQGAKKKLLSGRLYKALERDSMSQDRHDETTSQDENEGEEDEGADDCRYRRRNAARKWSSTTAQSMDV